MKFLSGNTFWNRWPCPAESKQASCSPKIADAIFANDAAVVRDAEADLGEVEMTDPGEGEADAAEDVVPFPHEHAVVLTQEWLHQFKADILVIGTPAAGASLKAGLLASVRSIAVARNNAHRNFLMDELRKFVKLHSLIPGYTAMALPPALARYAALRPQALRATVQAATPGRFESNAATPAAAASWISRNCCWSVAWSEPEPWPEPWRCSPGCFWLCDPVNRHGA